MSQVKGLTEIQNNMAKFSKNAERAMVAGLIETTAFLEHKSNQLAPKDTGFLREDSSFTTDIDKHGRVLVGRVGYDAEYAALVHELPEDSNFSTPGTGSKFLERAAKENQRTLTSIFTNTVKRIMRGL